MPTYIRRLVSLWPSTTISLCWSAFGDYISIITRNELQLFPSYQWHYRSLYCGAQVSIKNSLGSRLGNWLCKPFWLLGIKLTDTLDRCLGVPVFREKPPCELWVPANQANEDILASFESKTAYVDSAMSHVCNSTPDASFFYAAQAVSIDSFYILQTPSPLCGVCAAAIFRIKCVVLNSTASWGARGRGMSLFRKTDFVHK